jgi:hypothetical protein
MSIATLCSTLLSLDAAAQAQLNGTSPWMIINPGWAPEPDTGRGTMDIVWSCLVTIFACSWTVTHPMLHGKEESDSSKVWWFCMAVIAPEALTMVAFFEYLHARHYLKAPKKMNKGHWCMSQLFFVYMGGVKLQFEDCAETLGCVTPGIFDKDKGIGNFQRALQLDLLSIECLSTENIKKRARANSIVKAFVCLQSSWLVAQVIGRAVARFPITTLEVVTVGYVVCALVSYAFWWHKPQDAEVQITVNCKSLTKANFDEQINTVQDTPFAMEWSYTALLCAISGFFGAVHCTAWNFFFSTFAEKVTWRVASVLTVTIPPVLYLFVSSYGLLDWMKKVAGPALLVFVYIPFRLYLMIEPFVASRSVPVGIFYTVNWSTWIPHV